MNEDNQVSLSDNELEIILTISEYSTVDDMERKNVVDKKYFTDFYNSRNEYQKLIITNFLIFKGEMINKYSDVFNSIVNKDKNL